MIVEFLRLYYDIFWAFYSRSESHHQGGAQPEITVRAYIIKENSAWKVKKLRIRGLYDKKFLVCLNELIKIEKSNKST